MTRDIDETEGSIEEESHDEDGSEGAEGDPLNIELSVDTLLTVYEQTRIDRRQAIKQQGQVIISGTVAVGAILGYTIHALSEDIFASPLLIAIPLIIGMAMVFSIEAAKNKQHMSEHAEKIEEELENTGINFDEFGISELSDESGSTFPVHLWIIGGVPLILIIPLIILSILELSLPIVSMTEAWIAVLGIELVALSVAIYTGIQRLPESPI